jgi:hypothetical protein
MVHEIIEERLQEKPWIGRREPPWLRTGVQTSAIAPHRPPIRLL